MIIDAKWLLSNAQAITTSAASETTIDTGAGGAIFPGGSAVASPDAGQGTGLFLNCIVAVALATGTSLVVSLQHDTVTGFGSAVSILSTPAIVTASLNAAGIVVCSFALPRGLNRFLRAYYTIVGTYDTGSALTTWIGMAPVPTK
jgi:hypothetical protein